GCPEGVTSPTMAPGAVRRNHPGLSPVLARRRRPQSARGLGPASPAPTRVSLTGPGLDDDPEVGALALVLDRFVQGGLDVRQRVKRRQKRRQVQFARRDERRGVVEVLRHLAHRAGQRHFFVVKQIRVHRDGGASRLGCEHHHSPAGRREGQSLMDGLEHADGHEHHRRAGARHQLLHPVGKLRFRRDDYSVRDHLQLYGTAVGVRIDLIVGGGPSPLISSAMARRSGSGSLKTTAAARPRSSCTSSRPIMPPPMTSTRSPGPTPAFFTLRTTHATGSPKAASASGTWPASRNTSSPLRTMYSPKPPGPGTRPSGAGAQCASTQRVLRPRRQLSHMPHRCSPETMTLSPGRTWPTPAPAFWTTPDTSWPPASGYVWNTPEYTRCSHVHTAQYATLINTSSSAGSGTGTRSSLTSRRPAITACQNSPAMTHASYDSAFRCRPPTPPAHGIRPGRRARPAATAVRSAPAPPSRRRAPRPRRPPPCAGDLRAAKCCGP